MDRFSALKLLAIPLILGTVVAIAIILAPRFGINLPFSQPPKPQEITLRVWGLWEPESVFRPVLADFQKNHPNVKVVYQKQTLSQYRERLQARLGTADGPDVFLIHNTWVPMFKNSTASDLSPLPAAIMSQADVERTFYPTVKTDLRLGNSYYGLPAAFDSLVLYYNEDLLKAAGANTPPVTWDGIRQLAAKIAVKDPATGKLKTAGVGLGTFENVDHASDILGLMMLQNGVDFANPTDELAQDALRFFTLFVTDDKTWDPTWPPSTSAFAAGNLGLYFAPSWRVFEIKAANPNLNFKTAVVPQLAGGQVNWSTYWAWAVSAKSANQTPAWELVKFLTERNSVIKTYGEETKIRLFGEPHPRSDAASLLSSDPFVGPVLSQAQTARSWYLASNTQDNGINDRIIKYFKDAVNSVLSGVSIKQALDTTARGVSSVISQYK
ncbi:extracellular solute-binding protein [Candidatus Daviesbacteria bacterium]|nr:extracellular solute-binding protein [Candidatus Daviesbacteria bacterium]